MRTMLCLLGLMCTAPGCNWLNRITHRDSKVVANTDSPDVAHLVSYLNKNASRVKAVRCTDLTIDGAFDGQQAGVSGMLLYEKPKNFRLKARWLSQPAVDIGSNDKEFWYWFSKTEPYPYVFHCDYTDLQQGNVRMPFPFHPEMIIAALGISEYEEDPSKYQIKVQPQHFELIQSASSPQGKPIQKITVFNRREVGPGKPQVIAHVLRDAQGKDICTMSIDEVQTDRNTGAILPRVVRIKWPQEKAEMKMRFYGMESTRFDEDTAGRAFTRTDLTYTPFDLARERNTSGVVQTQATEPATSIGKPIPRKGTD